MILQHQGGGTWDGDLGRKKGEENHVDEKDDGNTEQTRQVSTDVSRQQAMLHTGTYELYVTLRSTSTWHVTFFLQH